jgi:predicted dehydrogenase
LPSSSFGVAFAGAGVVAELHHRALIANGEARLVGFFDPDRNLAATRSREWDVPSYADLGELVNAPEADAVFVLSPSQTHEEVAVLALTAGKHVLVEKPVASAAGCASLNNIAKRSGLVCMPGHNYAYQPEFRRLLGLAQRGELGEIRAMWVIYALKHEEELAARYSGVLQEVMVHHAYLTYAILGRPTRVFAGRATPSWEKLVSDDQAWMIWEYDPRTVAQLFASFAMDDGTSDPWTFSVKVLGTNGGGTYSWRSAALTAGLPGSHRFPLPCYEESYEYELQAFLKAARDGDLEAIASPMDHAIAVAELMSRLESVTSSDGGRPASGVLELS